MITKWGLTPIIRKKSPPLCEKLIMAGDSFKDKAFN
jgi:hypothetical protein